MESLNRCVVLALVLLQTVLGTEVGWTECRMASMSDGLTVLNCAEVEEAVHNSSYDLEVNNTLSVSEVEVDENQGYEDSNATLHRTLHQIISNSVAISGNKSNDNLTRSLFVQVNLLGNITVLDLTSFLFTKSVILNTRGFKIGKVCGANNILNVTVTSSSGDLSFLKFFSNLRFLNLSCNSIKDFPDSDLPRLISSIDLSFSSITLNKTYNLPKNLRRLNISYNNVYNTELFILKGNVIVLDISGNKLTRVPAIEMKSLEELYLSNNEITTLREKTFQGLLNLTLLNLRNNRLSDIEEKAFQGLNRLQWLDLSENDLISLAPATFQYLSNLVTLLLSKNMNLGNLQDFEDASLLFGTGQRLQEIEASGTNLSKIPSTVTRSVRRLLLSNNSISTIQCGEVDSFPLLQLIDVSNNMIAEIEEDALGRLEFLSDLILAGNVLTNVPKSLPNQLQVLDLRNNKINKLHNIDFLGLQKLRVLLLSTNNISTIEDGAFGQLINLDVLDISYNPIQTLYRSSFTGPRRLKELYLVGLTDLISLREPLSFPAPESSHLEILNLNYSPELATRLMDDVAALTMFHELYELSLRDCKLQVLPSDLPRYLPRLQKLEITNNPLNCSDIMWLVKWLQTLNVSAQDSNKIRINLYEKLYQSNVNKTLNYENACCASPDTMSGKALITLREDNITDVKIQYVPQTTFEPFTTLSTFDTTIQDSVDSTSNRPNENLTKMTEFITQSPPTSTRSTIATQKGYLNNLVKKLSVIPVRDSNTTLNKLKSKKSLNVSAKLHKLWEYSKNESKTHNFTSDPIIVLLNNTELNVKIIDNQVNDSISSGAFLSHEPPAGSHPGMMVFLFIVGVIVVASSAMVYSHCDQTRRSVHQDIEVANFGANDLW